ncbi:MAG: tRNA uridine-5-carboxymethylaminomethyl(34) synthesis enzyme MnmG [Clostridia bacterium]|nr:tRNA uridine-5-carboxymethylaminomethyl(34) synthesis enzyme MnmG [Clostridia bacterium]
MEYYIDNIDVAIIGAGHAGVEASLASARLGCKTTLFTISNDAVANMPCNPSIGGTGKGQLVFEIDALGGEMGRAADKVTLQDRMLNLSKGPAVHSKRVQADRRYYQDLMKKTIEHTDNLTLVQAEIVDIQVASDNSGNRLWKVITMLDGYYYAKAVVICTGTYLDSRIIIGEYMKSSGPDGMHAAIGLTESLKKLGVKIMRFKTGTPPRIDERSVNLEVLDKQDGDPVTPYSSDTSEEDLDNRPKMPCYIAYTNLETHKIIKDNINRSPLYSGQIEGIGPRYCPSIEDKVVRFSDKERHQLFLEPMGKGSNELYLQGFSSSMPADVQIRMLHSLKGFENAVVMRSAYAIEYDCSDPTQLKASLEFKDIPGLFGAGQFNGTSGYEEAAAQGIIAGINAAQYVKGLEPLTLTRNSSYIGTLIDDLVTKGTNEPYRMMTSRSEFRLILRQDNADSRLSELGHKVGLLSEERYQKYLKKQETIKNEKERLKTTVISPSETINKILESVNEPPITTGVHLADLLKRPTITYDLLEEVDTYRPKLPKSIILTVQTDIKYEGYIKKQLQDAERFDKLEKKLLPSDIDYMSIKGISIEASQKLTKFRPVSIGAASRISGVSPADITVLLIYLDSKTPEKHLKDQK